MLTGRGAAAELFIRGLTSGCFVHSADFMLMSDNYVGSSCCRLGFYLCCYSAVPVLVRQKHRTLHPGLPACDTWEVGTTRVVSPAGRHQSSQLVELSCYGNISQSWVLSLACVRRSYFLTGLINGSFLHITTASLSLYDIFSVQSSDREIPMCWNNVPLLEGEMWAGWKEYWERDR